MYARRVTGRALGSTAQWCTQAAGERYTPYTMPRLQVLAIHLRLSPGCRCSHTLPYAQAAGDRIAWLGLVVARPNPNPRLANLDLNPNPNPNPNPNQVIASIKEFRGQQPTSITAAQMTWNPNPNTLTLTLTLTLVLLTIRSGNLNLNPNPNPNHRRLR